MQKRGGFRNLDTWQLAMTLVERIYQATSKFPSDERYGLTSQVRRAAVSIPSNVAEGFCRRGTKTYAQHVAIALGSHGELETCLELAVRLKFLPAVDSAPLEQMLTSVGSLLSGLHRSLEDKIARDKVDQRAKRPRRDES
jgi:four helix bundle protein